MTESLHVPAPTERVQASAAVGVGGCVVIVGGRWGAGGRVCADPEEEHREAAGGCSPCYRRGIRGGNGLGLRVGYAGWDHRFYGGREIDAE